MNVTATDVHHGVRFRVEAVGRGDMFEGRFVLIDPPQEVHGAQDPFRPTVANRWATAAEALTYATEAAHHVIEGIAPFVARGRG